MSTDPSKKPTPHNPNFNQVSGHRHMAARYLVPGFISFISWRPTGAGSEPASQAGNDSHSPSLPAIMPAASACCFCQRLVLRVDLPEEEVFAPQLTITAKART